MVVVLEVRVETAVGRLGRLPRVDGRLRVRVGVGVDVLLVRMRQCRRGERVRGHGWNAGRVRQARGGCVGGRSVGCCSYQRETWDVDGLARDVIRSQTLDIAGYLPPDCSRIRWTLGRRSPQRTNKAQRLQQSAASSDERSRLSTWSWPNSRDRRPEGELRDAEADAGQKRRERRGRRRRETDWTGHWCALRVPFCQEETAERRASGQ